MSRTQCLWGAQVVRPADRRVRDGRLMDNVTVLLGLSFGAPDYIDLELLDLGSLRLVRVVPIVHR